MVRLFHASGSSDRAYGQLDVPGNFVSVREVETGGRSLGNWDGLGAGVEYPFSPNYSSGCVK